MNNRLDINIKTYKLIFIVLKTKIDIYYILENKINNNLIKKKL